MKVQVKSTAKNIVDEAKAKGRSALYRGVDEVKQEAAHKEVSKVREDKAR